jgi:hypothetical protein
MKNGKDIIEPYHLGYYVLGDVSLESLAKDIDENTINTAISFYMWVDSETQNNILSGLTLTQLFEIFKERHQ